MKPIRIRLSKGKYALVDGIDAPFLRLFKWHVAGKYAVTKVAPRGQIKQIHMHRVILGLGLRQYDSREVDHVNGNHLDNRIANLRTCSHSENMQNRRSKRNHSSKYRGVSWSKQHRKWQANAGHNGKSSYIGRFSSERQAARVAAAKRRELYGEFAGR